MKILIAPLNWGLGHATRCIPLIRQYLERGDEVVLGGDGESLLLLQRHFPQLRVIQLPSLELRYAANDQQRGFYLRAIFKDIIYKQPKLDADINVGSRREWYQKGYKDGLNADKWIPCSERLPECENGCETKALMFQIKSSDYIEVGHYGEGGKYRDRYFRTYTDTLEGFDASDVIAWQPLPEPYKGE